MWKTFIAMLVFAALVAASALPPSAAERRTPERRAAAQVKVWQVSQQVTDPTPPSDPRDMLEGGMKMMLQALDLMISAIPQYAAPEVLPNGDIIIRRLPSKPLPHKKSPDDHKPGGDRQI